MDNALVIYPSILPRLLSFLLLLRFMRKLTVSLNVSLDIMYAYIEENIPLVWLNFQDHASSILDKVGCRCGLPKEGSHLYIRWLQTLTRPINTRRHTHTHTYIYIFIYIYKLLWLFLYVVLESNSLRSVHYLKETCESRHGGWHSIMVQRVAVWMETPVMWKQYRLAWLDGPATCIACLLVFDFQQDNIYYTCIHMHGYI